MNRKRLKTRLIYINNSMVANSMVKSKCTTVNSLISGHHRGNDFCTLIGDVRLLESLTFLTFCCLGRDSLKILS